MSSDRPHCKHCGSPIRKETESHVFWDENTAPQTREDLKNFTNLQIMSVRYGQKRNTSHYDDDDNLIESKDPKDRYIRRFSTWDGESYVSPYFCADTTCGVAYAYRAAKLTDEIL